MTEQKDTKVQKPPNDPKQPEAKVAQAQALPKKQEPLTRPKPSIVAVKRLNDSALLLIDQLPDHIGQLLENLSTQYQIPIWQYTVGVILAVHLEGRLSEFRLDPAWKDGLKTKELQCKYKPCSKMFKPRHIGQPYCSNECGLAATGPKELQDDILTIPTKLPGSADFESGTDWGGVDADLAAA